MLLTKFRHVSLGLTICSAIVLNAGGCSHYKVRASDSYPGDGVLFETTFPYGRAATLELGSFSLAANETYWLTIGEFRDTHEWTFVCAVEPEQVDFIGPSVALFLEIAGGDQVASLTGQLDDDWIRSDPPRNYPGAVLFWQGTGQRITLKAGTQYKVKIAISGATADSRPVSARFRLEKGAFDR
jgi:hypothetical protein